MTDAEKKGTQLPLITDQTPHREFRRGNIVSETRQLRLDEAQKSQTAQSRRRPGNLIDTDRLDALLPD